LAQVEATQSDDHQTIERLKARLNEWSQREIAGGGESMIQMLSTYFESYTARLGRDEDGQGLVEYALIIALVSVFLIAALKVLGTDVDEVFGRIGGALDGAGT
jgi:pilus assembly protein Flp/PilA